MSVLTRIKNNQITDSTILANTKIVPGSIVGSLFNTNLTMTSDVTITGNLTVQGSSTYLTVASTNTYVNDPLIILNNAFSGTNTYDIGLLFNRGNQTTTALIWNEANDEFRLIYTTDDGTGYGAINNSGYGNIRVGNITATYDASFRNIDSSANLSVTQNAAITGDLAVNGGDITSAAGTFNLLTGSSVMNFATAATAIQIGDTTGILTLNNPTLVGSQTTQAVYNTVATTVNAFGAATALNIGAATGILTAKNANVWLPNATTIDGAQATVNLLTQNATTLEAFTNVTAANIGAGTGTFTINNPTVLGQQATQNLYNTVATQMNFAGAATALTIGATSGFASIRNANIALPNATVIYAGQTSLTLANTNVTTAELFGAATTLNLGATSGTATIRNAELSLLGNATVAGDLAVNGGDVTTTASTFNLVNANATTVDAFKAATDLEFGATTGTLTINNPTVVGSQTTQNVYNTTATTVNAFGAATTLTLAAATGNTAIRNNLDVGLTVQARDINGTVIGNVIPAAATFTSLTTQSTTNLSLVIATAINNTPIGNATPSTGAFTTLTSSGATTVTDTTDAPSQGTGALVVSGGASVAGNLWVGGNINIVGSSFVISGNAGVFYGDVSGFGALYAGVAGYTPLPSTVVQTAGAFNGYIQNNFENLSTGEQASTDWVATSGNGTDVSHYINMGITSPNWDGTQDNSLTTALTGNDGYLYVQGNTASGGNLVIGTSTLNRTVQVIVGGNTASNITAVYRAPGTVSSSTTTGALTVTGGVGISGNLTANNIGITNSLSATDLTLAGNLVVNGGDLEVNGGDLTTTASAFNLLNANATTVDAFKAATDLEFGATSGTLTINNPTVVGTQTTQAVFNTTATTINFAGAATTLNIGADTGTVTINNNTIDLEGNVNINKTTPSTNSTSGALIVDGGVGIAGNLNVGQNVVITGNLTVQGDVTTLNTSTLDVEDLNITVAKGAADSAAADGAGLTVDGASATILYTHATTSWDLNKITRVTNDTNTTNETSGALRVAGGASIAKDLFVGGGNIITDETTFNLLDVTVTTLNIGGAATAIDLGATTGALTINNPTVVGSQTSQDLYNTTATTLNFAGAATTLTIGATTGTTNIRNALVDIDGNATVGGTLGVTGDTTLTANLAVNGGYLTTTAGTFSLLDANATTVDAFKAATDLEFGATSGTLTINNPTVVGSQSTQNLYNTTATTLNFAGAVTTANVGAGTGTFTLNNPTLVGSQTTQNVYNTVATTVNAFGAATSLVLGATTGTLNLRNANIYLPNATTLYSGQSTLDIANVNVTTLSIGGAATEFVLGATTGTLTLRNATVTTPGQIISTRAGSAVDGNGQIYLNGSTSNRIDWNTNGTGAPAFTTRSVGTKLTLYPAIGASAVDYAIGIDSATLWNSIPGNDAGQFFKWYGGTTEVANLSGIGDFTTVGDVAVNGGDLTTTASAFNLVNANATTLNVGGAATSVVAGDTTGTFNIRNANIYLPNAANIASTQSTVAVFNTDTTTINAFGAATALTLGATSGTASLRNANIALPNATVIYSGQTSLSLANTVTTTVNAFGAATTLNFASGTGSTTIRNSTTSLGILYANSATASTSSTTGGLVVAGGTGIDGKLFVGTSANIPTANITATISSTAYNNGALTVAGGVGVAGNLSVKLGQQITVGVEDPQANISFPDRQLILIANANVAAGTNMRNISSAPSASSNYFAIADNNVGESHFIATGITSSGFNAAGGIIYANDSYVTNKGGNLIIAADPNKDLILATGSTPVLKYSWVDANISIPTPVISTSTSTGALTVTGGVGIGSNIWVANGAVINDAQTSDNFTVKGKVASSLIVANSNYGAVVIGGSNASPQLGATLKVNSTDSILLPKGATADRPSNSGNVDVAGMIRFNTSINTVEYYTGSTWAAAGSDTTFTIITNETFNGNGLANTYTLSDNTTTNGTVVSINGILQIPTVSYSITGNSLVFTENPADGDLIDVRILSTTQTVGDVTSADGLNTFTPDNTYGAAIYSGTAVENKAIRATAKPDGTWAYVNGTKTTYDQTATATSTTITVIDSFPASNYSSAKYIVQTKNGSDIESMEALVVATSTEAYITTFGIVASNVSLGSLTANVVSGNVRLYYNTALTNSNVKVYTTYIV